MNTANRSTERSPLIVEGLVENGDRRGRQIGFPTANLYGVDDSVEDGVYAGIVCLDPSHRGGSHVAAISVGRRSTYYPGCGARLLEAYLLGYRGNLYGSQVTVELHRRLRAQVRYRGTAELVQQLDVDVRETRRWAQRAGYGELLHEVSVGPEGSGADGRRTR